MAVANALAAETSPYLLQHSGNPVDWHPWGDAARALARELDRPLLVSIGYSACHWCHVMAHESFEDPAVAAAMNDRFVCVKVDREERPDVDALCMEACQTMTGHGGWPLNCFLTPDEVPFFAGTYFPSQPRPGMPTWTQVLDAVASAWRDRRADVVEQGARLSASLGGLSNLPGDDAALVPATLDAALDGLRAAYDPRGGGFGSAPKFPQASLIEFLLTRGEREMSLGMLRAMAAGGIHDQVGGGFARYGVDATWTVPHFEKMLYDNALLARAYLHGFQASGDAGLRRVCEDTLDWALRELRGPEGGFYAALDADSEGVEGRYYVWSESELRATLGDGALADAAVAWLGVTEAGNFEGVNVLTGRGPEPPPDQRAEIRDRLLAARERRVRPGTDDKRLTCWNALMIAALADAGAGLARPEYLDAAVACAQFVWRDLRVDGRLRRTFKDGRARIPAYLEDHTALLEALLVLFEATGDARWYARATEVADMILADFADDERGGFFTTAADAGTGLPRRHDLDDAPTPSGSSSAALGLLRLAALSGETRYEQAALGVLRVLAPVVGRHPLGFGHGLQALDLMLARVDEVAIAGSGPDADALCDVVRRAYTPHVVLATGSDEDAADGRVPLLRDRPLVDGRPAAYVCEGFACRAPVTTPAALAEALGR